MKTRQDVYEKMSSSTPKTIRIPSVATLQMLVRSGSEGGGGGGSGVGSGSGSKSVRGRSCGEGGDGSGGCEQEESGTRIEKPPTTADILKVSQKVDPFKCESIHPKVSPSMSG